MRDASLKVPPGIEGTIVDVKIFSRKGAEKDIRQQEIEGQEISRLEKNTRDEIRIFSEERNKKITDLLLRKTVTAAVKSRAGEKLLDKGESHHAPGAAGAVAPGDPALAGRRPACDRCGRDRLPEDGLAHRDPPQGQQGEDRAAPEGRRAAARRDQAGQGLRRHEAQAAGGRQDGGTPRQQGRDLADPAGRGHALPARRHAGRDRAQSAGRALANERRSDPRDPPRLGGQGAGPAASRHRCSTVRREADLRELFAKSRAAVPRARPCSTTA